MTQNVFMYTKTDAYNFNTVTQVAVKYRKLTIPTKVKNIKNIKCPPMGLNSSNCSYGSCQ